MKIDSYDKIPHTLKYKYWNQQCFVHDFLKKSVLSAVFSMWALRAYKKLVWSHQGNQVATNGSGKTPNQFSNWSKNL